MEGDMTATFTQQTRPDGIVLPGGAPAPAVLEGARPLEIPSAVVQPPPALPDSPAQAHRRFQEGVITEMTSYSSFVRTYLKPELQGQFRDTISLAQEMILNDRPKEAAETILNLAGMFRGLQPADFQAAAPRRIVEGTRFFEPWTLTMAADAILARVNR